MLNPVLLKTYGRKKYKLINLLGVEGNFENDLNYWTKSGTGTAEVSPNRYRTGTKSLHISLSASNVILTKDIAATNGDKFYCCLYANVATGPLTNSILRLFDYGGTSNPVIVGDSAVLNGLSNNQWNFCSNIKVAANGGTRLFANSTVNATVEFYVDSLYVINLTKAFGAGKEPSKASMDNYMQSQLSYFIEKRASIK